MKHLKKFNENADETLEPQDLLDFTQDLVDDGYTVKYITGAPYDELLPSDIISNSEKCASFDIYYFVFLRLFILIMLSDDRP